MTPRQKLELAIDSIKTDISIDNLKSVTLQNSAFILENQGMPMLNAISITNALFEIVSSDVNRTNDQILEKLKVYL